MKVKSKYKANFEHTAPLEHIASLEHKASLKYKTIEDGCCLIFGHYFLISLKIFFGFFLALILFSNNLLLSLTVLFFYIIRKVMMDEFSISIVLSHGPMPPYLNLFSESMEEHS